MSKTKKFKDEEEEEEEEELEPPQGTGLPPALLSEKEELLALYQKLKDLGVNSISDLEVKISRL